MPQLFTILFVEDDTAVRDVVIRILSEKGFGVLTASDAHDAVKILAARPVDLLFADIILPGIKVLFTTGYAQKAIERGAMRHGKVLFKPVREPELVREVALLLAA